MWWLLALQHMNESQLASLSDKLAQSVWSPIKQTRWEFIERAWLIETKSPHCLIRTLYYQKSMDFEMAQGEQNRVWLTEKAYSWKRAHLSQCTSFSFSHAQDLKDITYPIEWYWASLIYLGPCIFKTVWHPWKTSRLSKSGLIFEKGPPSQ